MRTRKLSALVAATATVAATFALVPQAMADPSVTPAATDLVGVGSDTTEYVVQQLADEFNKSAGSNPHLYSWNALNPTTGATEQITPKTGATTIARPNGSGKGKAALIANSNATVDFARSSSSQDATKDVGLTSYPFALDTLRMATAATTNAPAGGLNDQQVLDIYLGKVTNWSQLGGKSGVIAPYIPQTGSGTRSFFLDQLGIIRGAPVTVSDLAPSVHETQEHSAKDLAGNANAVAPFSWGRAKPLASQISLTNGFFKNRALYNVIRTGDTRFNTIFVGSSSFFCGPTAKPIIEANGFWQLTTACGLGTTSSAASLNAAGWVAPAAWAPTTQRTPAVVKSATTVNIAVTKVGPAKKKGKKKVVLNISVTGKAASGTVTVTETIIKKKKKKKITIIRPVGNGGVVNGTATVALPRLKKGKHVITVSYSGDANNLPSSAGAAFRS